MRKSLQLLSVILFICINAVGQGLNPSINKDSLLQEVVKELPKDIKKKILKEYKKGNSQTKEFLLFTLAMPRSSKSALIENYEMNKTNILELKKYYQSIVPDSFIISVEFNPADKLLNTKESIDLKIFKKLSNGELDGIKQEWNLDRNSTTLNEMMKTVGWNLSILDSIKNQLDKASCVSIENGEISTIGFARSGMGKYFYKVFDINLDTKRQSEFNDGCTYIFYKDNIVLEYGGGAIGSQCFPDK
jgi:hypothetical protein